MSGLNVQLYDFFKQSWILECSRLSKSLNLRILAFVCVLDEEVNTEFSGDCPPF